MSFEIDTPFDLEKIRLDTLIKLSKRALVEFEENPNMCWTQVPMERPLFETLKTAVEKQIPELVETIPGDYTPDYNCPICGETTGFEHQKYCIECGQSLEW